MRRYVKAKRGGRSGREPQLPRVADQHDAQASRVLVAWHGAPAPCQLTDATDHGALESSGVGLPAVAQSAFLWAGCPARLRCRTKALSIARRRVVLDVI